MSLLHILYQLMIGPIQLLLESVFGLCYVIVKDYGTVIIPLSLTVNFLLLPFYNRADRVQSEEHERERKLAAGVTRIKKAFHGDERYMMLQTFYRQKHYKPIYALRSSLPLLLEIPFFIAAYQFLSHLQELNGASFGPIRDLGAPDGLISIAGITINALPIIMTLINLASGSVYARRLSTRDKVQLFGMAALFLVLLYRSPSGLVLYWTLNNLFSLVKNLVNSVEHKAFVTCSVLSALGALILFYSYAASDILGGSRPFVFAFALLFELPALWQLLKKKTFSITAAVPESNETKMQFFWGCLLLTVLTGALIPSSVVKTSPAEFILLSNPQSPLNHIWNTLLLSAGTFLLWLQLFYSLAGKRAKTFLSAGIWLCCGAALFNYMLFGTKLGLLSPQLQYEEGIAFPVKDMIINAVIIVLVCAFLLFIWWKKRSIVRSCLIIAFVAVLGMSIVNSLSIQSSYPAVREAIDSGTVGFAPIKMSKNRKNVVVLMLDKASSAVIPYLFQENPELERQFDGFTFYPNTISYGCCTNVGSPAIYGGYDYTPEGMNSRPNEALVAKHNEALKTMPVMFSKAGFDVTVCDPPYANYNWIPDLTIFSDYPEIQTYNTENGQLRQMSVESEEEKTRLWERNFFCYSIMKISPLVIQPVLYQDGTYLNPNRIESIQIQIQVTEGVSKATGVQDNFVSSYEVLCSLPDMVYASDMDKGSFIMLYNSTVHNPMILKEPEYEPSWQVDNTEYDRTHAERFTLDGRTMHISTPGQMRYYQSSMAAMIKIGEWMDALRTYGLYDNTRIIIVSDHGSHEFYFDDMIFGPGEQDDAMLYNALLLVKDFDSRGYSVDYQFMTNADTPVLAFDGLIDDPVSPFTGKPINSEPKLADEQHVFLTLHWQAYVNSGNTFLPGTWYSIKNHNLLDISNWEELGKW